MQRNEAERTQKRLMCNFKCSMAVIAKADKEQLYVHSSNTAQGGGSRLKKSKPIGEIACCESRMAEKKH